jgi:alanyl-tRNA synthetase
METVRLFYTDPYQVHFSAVVQEVREEKGKILVRLERTCFYPEGGGQPCDTGRLNGVRVVDVQERGGEIWHTVEAPLEVGAPVDGEIDWERRFDLMQQHSGEHILSGILHEMTGCDNVGFHLTTENVYVDFDKPMDLPLLREAELRANRYIWENHPVEIDFPDAETLAALPYRSKKELTGDVRIVTFPGADICACCGTHVERSGAVGCVKVLSCQNYKSGVRVEIACGRRALETATVWMEQAQEVGRMLSVKPEQAVGAVQKLSNELGALRLKLARMEEQQFAKKAEELADAGNVLLFEEGLTPDGVRKLCTLVAERCGGRCAVFSGSDADGYKYAVGETDGDLRELVKKLNKELNGRGGGKPFFAQGSVQAARAEIEAFFREVAG